MANITSVRVFGERCSGTNFLEALLIKNVPFLSDRKELKSGAYGYKHWFCENLDALSLADDTLFLVVFRNPVKWLTSLSKTPFHSSPELKKLPFSEFIRREWSCVWDEQANVKSSNPKYATEMMHERNPLTGDRFANVLELRNAKLTNWLELTDVAKNVAFLSYEKLVESPDKIFADLTKRFGLITQDEIKREESYRGFGKKRYKPKPDPVISNADAQYICDNLDWKLEAVFGYSPDEVRKFIGG